jgi:hypothetical protein
LPSHTLHDTSDCLYSIPPPGTLPSLPFREPPDPLYN